MATDTWLCVNSILHCTDCGYIVDDKDPGQDNVYGYGRSAMTYHFNTWALSNLPKPIYLCFVVG